MAKGASTTMSNEPGAIERFQTFLQDVKVEMSKVAWPSKEEVKSNTVVVSEALLMIAAIIFLFDWVFLQFIRLLLLLS